MQIWNTRQNKNAVETHQVEILQFARQQGALYSKWHRKQNQLLRRAFHLESFIKRYQFIYASKLNIIII